MAVGVLVCAAARQVSGHQGQTQSEPTIGEIGRLLASSDLKDQAWGAWWAAGQKLAAVEPQFLAVYAQRQDEALILGSQSSLPLAAIDPLLERAAAERTNWIHGSSLAAAELLLIRHSPDVVPRVLRSVSFTAHVVMCDPSSACEPIGGGYGGSWPSSIPDPAYPPWAHYELVPVDRAGTTEVIHGPTPATSLSYRRYFGSSMPPTRGPVTGTERMAVVAAAASGIAMPVLDGATLRVIWQDEASFNDARERFRLDLLQRYAALLDQLQKAGPLTAPDAASVETPDLKIVVDDRRKKRQAAFPEV